MGSENYAYFHLEGTRVESDQLEEIAQDAGLGEVPSASGGETALVARLNEQSKIAKSTDAELWVDTRRLYLFDPETGKSLAREDAENGAAKPADEAPRPNSGRGRTALRPGFRRGGCKTNCIGHER